MKGNRNKYNFILVLSPKAEDKDKEKVISQVEKMLSENNAVIAKKDHTGMKELVYDVAGFRKGDFWSLEVTGEKPLKINDINLFLNRETNVIRYLILKY